jgi:GNAT superfamily N-acetyltransferase
MLFHIKVRAQKEHGYEIAYITEFNKVVCVAGFRITSNLCLGKNLYIDDLVTGASDRSSGYGMRMIEWLTDLAVRNGCCVINLDSGTHRGRAHKFYFQSGFTIGDYHFYKEL